MIQPKSQAQGFSLIEILVVLFIIGIMFTVATLNFSDFGKHYYYRYQIERLAKNIESLREKAIVENTLFAFDLKNNQFHFFKYEKDKWLPLNQHHAFRDIDFPKTITFKQTPNIGAQKRIIYSDGHINAFSLTLYEKNKNYFTSKLSYEQDGRYFVYPDEQTLKKNQQ